MQSEKDLLKRFKKIVDEIEFIAKKYYREGKAMYDNRGRDDTYKSTPEHKEYAKVMAKKINELETIALGEVLHTKKVSEIVEDMRKEMMELIQTTQVTKTERELRKWLSAMKNMGIDSPRLVFDVDVSKWGFKGKGYVAVLRELELSEEEIVKMRERAAKIIEKLSKAVKEEID